MRDGNLFEVTPSAGLVPWLEEQKLSLAVSTYQAGKMLFFGPRDDGQLWIFNRNIGHCLGMSFDDKRDFYISTSYGIYHFSNLLEDSQQTADGCDLLLHPQTFFVTGDLDTHDLQVTADGRVIFVATQFNCIAELAPSHSFLPIWRPPFVSELVAEDRCHLNGLSLVNGVPKYVTICGVSDQADGWRALRVGGGIVMDIETNEVVCEGLSMPHSPRWHEGVLYVHDSATGYFGRVNMQTKAFEPIAFLPGYLRGLGMYQRTALMGTSMPRGNDIFRGLPLEHEMSRREETPKCGVYFVDLDTGEINAWFQMRGIVDEIYDVVPIVGKRKVMAHSPHSEHDMRRVVSFAPH